MERRIPSLPPLPLDASATAHNGLTFASPQQEARLASAICDRIGDTVRQAVAAELAATSRRLIADVREAFEYKTDNFVAELHQAMQLPSKVKNVLRERAARHKRRERPQEVSKEGSDVRCSVSTVRFRPTPERLASSDLASFDTGAGGWPAPSVTAHTSIDQNDAARPQGDPLEVQRLKLNLACQLLQSKKITSPDKALSPKSVRSARSQAATPKVDRSLSPLSSSPSHNYYTSPKSHASLRSQKSLASQDNQSHPSTPITTNRKSLPRTMSEEPVSARQTQVGSAEHEDWTMPGCLSATSTPKAKGARPSLKTTETPPEIPTASSNPSYGSNPTSPEIGFLAADEEDVEGGGSFSLRRGEQGRSRDVGESGLSSCATCGSSRPWSSTASEGGRRRRMSDSAHRELVRGRTAHFEDSKRRHSFSFGEVVPTGSRGHLRVQTPAPAMSEADRPKAIEVKRLKSTLASDLLHKAFSMKSKVSGSADTLHFNLTRLVGSNDSNSAHSMRLSLSDARSAHHTSSAEHQDLRQDPMNLHPVNLRPTIASGIPTNKNLSVQSHHRRPGISLADDGTMEHMEQADVNQLRKHRVHELVQDVVCHSFNSLQEFAAKKSSEEEVGEQASEDPCIQAAVTASVPLFLRVCGILPWNADNHHFWRSGIWYQWLVVLLAALSCASSVQQALVVLSPVYLAVGCPERDCIMLGLLSDIALSLGAVAGLIALDTLRSSKALRECRMLLLTYAYREGILQPWMRRARLDCILTITVWLVAVAGRLWSSGLLQAVVDGSLHIWDLLYFAPFFISTGLLAGLSYCLLYICRPLALMVDKFCYFVAAELSLTEAVDMAEAISRWNVLQAVLRMGSSTIEYCFFIMQTVLFSAVLLFVADVLGPGMGLVRSTDNGGTLDLAVPGAIVVAGMARIFFCAASVTDKCAHVPSLLNSLWFGHDLDPKRQYVVEYIIHSDAGFYIFDVRLTSGLALRFMYLVGVISFALTSRALSER